MGYSIRYGITPTPTSSKVNKAIIQLLPQNINGKIVELGSGWGNLAFLLARHYPLARIEAYEISPIPYLLSCLLNRWYELQNIKFIRGDFFKFSIADSQLVVCYLFPKAMERLKLKFERELLPGTFILTHSFAVPGWTPLQIIYADDLYRTPVYLYVI